MNTNRLTPENEFADRARESSTGNSQGRGGLAYEFWYFLRTEKKWWLAPILLSFLVLSFFAFLTGTAIAPFIYSLF